MVKFMVCWFVLSLFSGLVIGAFIHAGNPDS